jgi:hypothetical protein
MKLSPVSACRDLRNGNIRIFRCAIDVDCESEAEHEAVGRLLRQLEWAGKIMAVSDLDGPVYGVIFSDWETAEVWREKLGIKVAELAVESRR